MKSCYTVCTPGTTKRKVKGVEYNKEYDAMKCRQVFQPKWLEEFSWLTMDTAHGVMKCKICCAWPNVLDPKSPLVMGSDKFRKDPLYARAKSANHVACVIRNDSMNIPLKNTPIGKAVVHSQKKRKFIHNITQMHCYLM